MSPGNESLERPPCRLQLLVAARAPLVCVIRRGPTAWFHVASWNYQAETIEHGAWTKIKLYPERCAISARGDRLAVFALGGEWGPYFAVSRPPWLQALAAWRTVGTWTTGARFEQNGGLVLTGCADAEPFHGSYADAVSCEPLDMHWVRARLQRELSSGWRLHVQRSGGNGVLPQPEWLEDLPAPILAGPDAVVAGKKDPAGSGRELLIVSLAEGEREYYLRSDESMTHLSRVANAEWTPDGRMLTATTDGRLELLDDALEPLWVYDMNRVAPDPRPAPDWATHW